MTDKEISTAMDDIGAALHARGKSVDEIELFLATEVARVCDELDNEENDFSK